MHRLAHEGTRFPHRGTASARDARRAATVTVARTTSAGPPPDATVDRDTAADKVLRLLLSFEDATEVPLSELARATGLPKSTAHRLLDTLVRHGLVERGGSGGYRLGFAAWKFGRRARPYDAFAREAVSHLRRLTETSGESSFLTVPEDDHALCIATVPSPSLMRLTLEPGSLAPMHLGASNRILLAFLPPRARDRVVDRWAEDEAERTALKEDLRRIRHDRFVLTSSQLTSGATAVGVPVLDEKGALIAGLSLGGPSDRFDASAAHATLGALRDHADALAHHVAPFTRHAATP